MLSYPGSTNHDSMRFNIAGGLCPLDGIRQWLHRPGGEVAGKVPGGRAVVVRCLGEPGEDEPRRQLTADLLAERVTVLDRRLRPEEPLPDRKSTRLNSSHSQISYAVF